MGLYSFWGCFLFVGFFKPVFAECFIPDKTVREDQCYNITLHKLKNFPPSVCKDGPVKCKGGYSCPWHVKK